jgi:hypothetical protein
MTSRVLKFHNLLLLWAGLVLAMMLIVIAMGVGDG